MELWVQHLQAVRQGLLPLQVPAGVGTRRQGVVAGEAPGLWWEWELQLGV